MFIIVEHFLKLNIFEELDIIQNVSQTCVNSIMIFKLLKND
jgi:hypothetical protein